MNVPGFKLGERSQFTAMILTFFLAIQPWVETNFPGAATVLDMVVKLLTGLFGLFFAGKVQRMVKTNALLVSDSAPKDTKPEP